LDFILYFYGLAFLLLGMSGFAANPQMGAEGARDLKVMT
jgi:hypothetical protein